MRKQVIRKQVLMVGALLVAGSALASGADNKWRLQFSGGAESDGHIVLELAPAQGDPIRATADIHKGRSENGVARDVRDALRVQVGKRYNVETDDGEDVLVKKRRGEPDFVVTIVENNVQGVRINPETE